MKERILYGWNVRRILYLIIGVAIIVYSIIAGEWWGAFLGGYFAAMELFSFGCTGGACTTNTYAPPKKYHQNNMEHIPYEEIKTE